MHFCIFRVVLSFMPLYTSAPLISEGHIIPFTLLANIYFVWLLVTVKINILQTDFMISVKGMMLGLDIELLNFFILLIC